MRKVIKVRHKTAVRINWETVCGVLFLLIVVLMWWAMSGGDGYGY